MLLSSVVLLQRQLRKLNEFTVTCYVALAMFIAYGAAVLNTPDGLSLLFDFNMTDWIVVVGLGFSSTFVQFCINRAI
jgi:hypothetical protein